MTQEIERHTVTLKREGDEVIIELPEGAASIHLSRDEAAEFANGLMVASGQVGICGIPR